MKTSTKLIIWATGVAAMLGIWSLIQWAENRPSGVHKAVVVEVSGCGAIDLNLCHTVVDFEGVRLSRGGSYGDVGDTLLIVQFDGRRWVAPGPREMRKYREGR